MPEEIQPNQGETVRIDYAEVLKTSAMGALVAGSFIGMTPLSILRPIQAALKVLRKPKQPKPSHIDNIRQIIKTAKEEGVKEMEIQLDKSIGGSIDLRLFKDLGVNVEFKRSDFTLIKVTYDRCAAPMP